MKRHIIVILLLFKINILVSCDLKYDWNTIADSIASLQKKECDSIYHFKIDLYNTLRKDSRIRTYIDSTAFEGDTIIIMEYHNPYKATANCVTWVKGNPSSFLIYDKYFNFNRDDTRCYWPVFMRELCNDWNVAGIRHEERFHPYEPLSPDNKAYIMATRVVLKPQRVFIINTIFLGHFLLYPRDKF